MIQDKINSWSLDVDCREKMLEPKEEQDKMLVTRDETTSGRTDLLSLKGVCKYAVRLVLSLFCRIDRK